MVSSAYPGMTLLASKGNNEYETFAQFTVDNPIPDIHFSDNGAAPGQGVAPPPPASTGAPRAQPFTGRGASFQGQGQGQGQSQQPQEGPASLPGAGEIPPAHGASLQTAYSEALANEPQGSGGEQDQMVDVPGLGRVPLSSIPPEARAQMIQQRQLQQQQWLQLQQQRQLQMQQQQQQQQQQIQPQGPPLPNYDKHEPVTGSGGTEAENEGYAVFQAVDRLLPGSSKYVIPLGVFIGILVILYLMVRGGSVR